MVRVLDDVRCDDADNNTTTETTTHNWLSLSKFFFVFCSSQCLLFYRPLSFWLFSLIHYLLYTLFRPILYFISQILNCQM